MVCWDPKLLQSLLKYSPLLNSSCSIQWDVDSSKMTNLLLTLTWMIWLQRKQNFSHSFCSCENNFLNSEFSPSLHCQIVWATFQQAVTLHTWNGHSCCILLLVAFCSWNTYKEFTGCIWQYTWYWPAGVMSGNPGLKMLSALPVSCVYKGTTALAWSSPTK